MSATIGNLQRLPLELRYKIYEYVVGDITSLAFTPPHKVTILATFRKKLPPSLNLNHQIANEAAAALRHRTLLIAEDLETPDPADLLSNLLPNMLLKRVRQLTITTPQPRYSSPTSPSPLHNLVMRCPQLRNLTVPVKCAMLLSPPDNGAAPPSTPQELATATGFDAVFEHGTLEKLNITCGDAYDPKDFWNPLYKIFLPFAEWLQAETEACGGRVKLDIDVTPSTVDPTHRETWSDQSGCLRWTRRYDWFA